MLAVGTVVGARRWPNEGSHPDAWLTPRSGVILAEDDPRAWQGTVAFGPALPSQAAVRAHLDWLAAQGRSLLRRPVLWQFEDGREQAWWERDEVLVPFDQDVKHWEYAREQARRSQLPLAA